MARDYHVHSGNATAGNSGNPTRTSQKKAHAGNAIWQKVTIGSITGIVLGSAATAYAHQNDAAVHVADLNTQDGDAGILDNVATTVTASTEAAAATLEAEPVEGEVELTATNDVATYAEGETMQPVAAPTNTWADQSIDVATNVSDSMSFSEAFAAARAEVGAGGAFEWYGNVYGTYYGNEWDAMSPAEKQDYNSHFSWSEVPHSSSDSGNASHSYQPSSNESYQAPSSSASSEGIYEVADEEEEIGEAEVEVLGVVHDEEYNANVGAMVVGDQEVYLIDADNDLTFDVAMADRNNNHEFEEDEVADISGQHITVEDLGGFTDGSGLGNANDDLALNGGPDYVNDADGVYEF